MSRLSASRSPLIPKLTLPTLNKQVYFIMLVGYKLYYRTELIPLTEVDLVSGRREFDEDEAAEAEEDLQVKKPWWKKLWESA